MNNTGSDLTSMYIIVRGRVQGVYFRAFTQHHANALKLTGFVRNLHGKNAVEVYAEGERKNLRHLLHHLHQGPPGAIVQDIETKESKYTGEFLSFEVKY